jgi:hypothetical protein
MYSLSGQIILDHVKQLQAEFERETLWISLDIRELCRIDREVVPILAHWNSEGIGLRHCPAYLSHWLEDIRNQIDP